MRRARARATTERYPNPGLLGAHIRRPDRARATVLRLATVRRCALPGFFLFSRPFARTARRALCRVAGTARYPAALDRTGAPIGLRAHQASPTEPGRAARRIVTLLRSCASTGGDQDDSLPPHPVRQAVNARRKFSADEKKRSWFGRAKPRGRMSRPLSRSRAESGKPSGKPAFPIRHTRRMRADPNIDETKSTFQRREAMTRYEELLRAGRGFSTQTALRDDN